MLAFWLFLAFGSGILVGFACAMSTVLVVMDGLKHIDCAKVAYSREKIVGVFKKPSAKQDGEIIKRNKVEEIVRSKKDGDIALADVLEDA